MRSNLKINEREMFKKKTKSPDYELAARDPETGGCLDDFIRRDPFSISIGFDRDWRLIFRKTTEDLFFSLYYISNRFPLKIAPVKIMLRIKFHIVQYKGLRSV